jgi:hypothetical protein
MRCEKLLLLSAIPFSSTFFCCGPRGEHLFPPRRLPHWRWTSPLPYRQAIQRQPEGRGPYPIAPVLSSASSLLFLRDLLSYPCARECHLWAQRWFHSPADPGVASALCSLPRPVLGKCGPVAASHAGPVFCHSHRSEWSSSLYFCPPRSPSPLGW